MDAQTVYRKSEKGSEAIATRAYGVGGKLRMLLILVDGRKNVAELTKLAAGLGESVTLLEQLVRDGLIESATEAATEPGGLAGGEQAPLRAAKSHATHLLIEQLGSMADELAMKVESAEDRFQFADIIRRAGGVLRELKGEETAARFHVEVEARLPPA